MADAFARVRMVLKVVEKEVRVTATKPRAQRNHIECGVLVLDYMKVKEGHVRHSAVSDCDTHGRLR